MATDETPMHARMPLCLWPREARRGHARAPAKKRNGRIGCPSCFSRCDLKHRGDRVFAPQSPSPWRAPRSSGFLRLTLNPVPLLRSHLAGATQNTMSSSDIAFAAALTATLLPHAQGTGNASIAVEQPWPRAKPSGAQTGAAYMTIDNKSGTADRLTGASSNVADKLQIHEMSVVNGVMQMRELADGLPIPADGRSCSSPAAIM